MFDTGGGERANSMTQQYYKNSQIVCLVYSLNSEISFTALGKWIEDACFYLEESQRHNKMVFALVGVKSDIPQHEREVKPGDVIMAAHHFNISEDCCFEVSNITGDGVTQMMQKLTQRVLDLQTRQTSHSSSELHTYSTDVTEPHENINIEGTVTFKRWFYYCCCCCYCCCKRARQAGYEELSGPGFA